MSIYHPYDGGPESVVHMQQAGVHNTYYNGELSDRARSDAITATAQVINQIGCADVIQRLDQNGALEAVGTNLLFRGHYEEGERLLTAAADSDIIKPQNPGKRPATFVDEVAAHEAMDSAFVNSSTSDRAHSNTRRGAATNFEFYEPERLERLRDAMPHLAQTRVFAIGSGAASLALLWGLRTAGIGTATPETTTIVSGGNIGGIWSDPNLPGVRGRSKNNPVPLSLENPRGYRELPGSGDLKVGSGSLIADWTKNIARDSDISSNYRNSWSNNMVTPKRGRVVAREQNPDYSHTVTWIDEYGQTHRTVADIVLGGLGLQKPLEFITPRLPMLDSSNNMLYANPLTKGKTVELYYSANNDVRLSVHRWQEQLDQTTLDKMRNNRGRVLIFGVGNSAIEMMSQLDEQGIPYYVITDNPARVVRQPEKSHIVNGKIKRLARNKDPYEFDLQNGVAYDLPTARRVINNNQNKIVSGVQNVRWLPGNRPSQVRAEIHFGDGRQPLTVDAQADIYALFGYGIDTAAAEDMGMVVTRSGRVLTDTCGQVKAADGTTQVGFLTMGAHIEGGANKGIIPGFLHMLPNAMFAGIAQAERRYIVRQDNASRSIGRLVSRYF